MKILCGENSMSVSSLNSKFIICLLFLGAPKLGAVEKKFWLKNLSGIKKSLNIPMSDRIDTINLPIHVLEKRIHKANIDKRVEPVVLTIKKDSFSMKEIARSLAFSENESDKVYSYFLDNSNHLANENLKSEDSQVKIRIKPQFLQLIDSQSFTDKYFKNTHHNVSLDSSVFAEESELLEEFIKQIKPFLEEDDLDNVMSKIKEHKKIYLDKDLLPAFPKKMVDKYTIFSGPNCFHSALSFQNMKIPQSQYYNVKREENYHPQMINHDELWRIINKILYPVPAHEPIKYGDMVVFFDLPKSYKEGDLINFRWIAHAAVYLFEDYTFSKGSKSPNTPYTIKTLAEEWRVWKKYTKNLATRIFRRSSNHASKHPPKDLHEWLE